MFKVRDQFLRLNPAEVPHLGEPYAKICNLPEYANIKSGYNFLQGPIPRRGEEPPLLWLPEQPPIYVDPNPAETARGSAVTIRIALAQRLEADRFHFDGARHFAPSP